MENGGENQQPLKVRFVCASLQEGDEAVGDLKPVLAYPHATWSWQKAYMDKETLGRLQCSQGMQSDILANFIPRPDLGVNAVELTNVKPAGIQRHYRDTYEDAPKHSPFD